MHKQTHHVAIFFSWGMASAVGTDRLSEDVNKEELVVLATGRAASELPVMPVMLNVWF